MEKIIAIFFAANCLMIGAANAELSESQDFVIKVNDIGSKCGLRPITQTPMLDKPIKFEVTAPQKDMDPFVKISKWEKTPTSVNPNNSYLQRIAVGKGRPVEMKNNNKMEDFFILSKRPHTTFTKNTEDAKLTLTLDCYTEADKKHYQNLKSRWEDWDWSGLETYSAKYGWNFETNTSIILNDKTVPNLSLVNSPD